MSKWTCFSTSIKRHFSRKSNIVIVYKYVQVHKYYRNVTEVHTQTHSVKTQLSTPTNTLKQMCRNNVEIYNRSTPQHLFRCSEHVPGQPVCLNPSIHMDNQTCLCSSNTQSHCLVHYLFYHPLPLLMPSPPPLSHAATVLGFSRHFVFHCLPFGEVTHDTW